MYHVIVREWNPETWELGPIYELKIDKMIQASKFSHFLSEHIFSHIDAENLFCCKVSTLRAFRRGDLALKRWNKLKQQMTWIGQSTLEVNRDAVYIIVKDNSKRVRETLTEEELRRYASPAYLDHMTRKNSREIGFQHKDAVFQAAQATKADFSKNKRPEKGIKIVVGGP